MRGVRNKVELVAVVAVKKRLDKRSARLLPLTAAITLCATDLMECLTLSHGLQMGDALIATTAIEHHLPVLAANLNHSGAVHGFTVEAFSPHADKRRPGGKSEIRCFLDKTHELTFGTVEGKRQDLTLQAGAAAGAS